MKARETTVGIVLVISKISAGMSAVVKSQKQPPEVFYRKMCS